MAKPDWKQTATTIAPLLTAAGIMASVSLLPHGASDPAGVPALVASLGSNLAASGLTALCDTSRLKALIAGKDRVALANHDIRSMIEASWGEAAIASLKAYCETHPDPPIPSVTSVDDHAAFCRVVHRLKAKDFVRRKPDVATIHTAVAEARRALLPSERSISPLGSASTTSPSDDAVREQVREQIQALNHALIQSVLDAVGTHLGKVPPPGDLRDFLDGTSRTGRVQSLLDHLYIYVAYYLKTNPRAQTAVLHYTLQAISDRQEAISQEQEELKERLANLCGMIRTTQTDLQNSLIAAFEKGQAATAERIQRHIDRAFDKFVQPTLDAPFNKPGGVKDFTFRTRRTPMLGREAAMDELLRFMGDARAGCWAVVSGQAGSGKSRLAAELIAMVRDPDASYAAGVPAGQWRAGFLRGKQGWLNSDALKWKADADTLIVIDYAAEADEGRLADFLAHIDEASNAISPGESPFQVRVLLIDRQPPDGPFGLARRLRSGRDSSGQLSANHWQSRSEATKTASQAGSASLGEPGKRSPMLVASADTEYKDALALEPVPQRAALQIVADWAQAKLSSEQKRQIEQAIANDPELARPLFAALMGEAIANHDLRPGTLSPVSVASSALRRLFKPEAQHPECRPLLRQTQDLLAAVTAAQGVAVNVLFNDDETLSQLTGTGQFGRMEIESLKRCLKQFSPFSKDGLGGDRFGALEPDFLGGLFVLESLAKEATGERAIDRAKLLMSFAWAHGQAPADFLVRLAGDFIGRAEQLHLAVNERSDWSTPDRVGDLLVALLLTGLSPQAIERNGPSAVGDAVYLASKADRPQLAGRLMDALESAYSGHEAAIDPLVLARAWFGLACSGGLPTSAQSRAGEAMERIGELLARHDTAEIALLQAKAFVNAIFFEQAPVRREALVERIGELLERHDTAEIALEQAKAFCNATVGEQDPVRCEALAEHIGKLLDRHDTPEIAPEIALVQAKAFLNATVVEQDPVRREPLAERIGDLLERHDTAEIAPEIALAQAKAFLNATVGEQDPVRREALAERIDELAAKYELVRNFFAKFFAGPGQENG